jgi:Spy/CpxP family protein refolding chaperone
MRVVRALAGGALLAALVLVSSDGATSQEKKDPAKAKGQIPQGWGKLNLTAAQKADIYAIQSEFKPKVEKLRDELKKLEAEERKKMVAVLTAEQKKMLTEGLIGEPSDPKEKPKTKD